MTRFAIGGAPHMPPQKTITGVMLQVLYALIPGIIAHWWFFGWGILFQLGLAVAAALLFEWLMLRARKQPVGLFMRDCSAPVTAVLFALCIPPLAPWWIAVVGMLFAIVIAKHLYGGLGHNLFNPAMIGYVVVLISFPREMTAWLPPQEIAEQVLSFSQTANAIFLAQIPDTLSWDAISQATPLDTIKTGIEQNRMVAEVRQAPIFGDFGGLGWEWIANWYALGGLWLLYRRVISWDVPVSMLATEIALTLPAYLIDSGTNPVPLQHVFSGAVVIGAFFIATDPVTGCASPRGKLVFGAGVAVITLVIRRWGGYPDGVAFGVLLMNMAVPLIDRYTRPRAYGYAKQDGHP